MTIDIEILAAWVGAVAAIGTPLFIIVNKATKLINRLCSLESWTKKQQIDIQNSKDERRILLTGTLACLKGLKEQGCNGPVTKAISDIEEFLLEQSHIGTSERR